MRYGKMLIPPFFMGGGNNADGKRISSIRETDCSYNDGLSARMAAEIERQKAARAQVKVVDGKTEAGIITGV